MTYGEIVKKIKSLEIQGATNVAIAAVEALAIKMKETKDPSRLKRYIRELSNLRATEPALRNALQYCLQNRMSGGVDEVKNHFIEGKKKIAEYGAKKIRDNMIVFTHCRSSTVEMILVKAKQQGKKITVYQTETRPKFQGRKTAENLSMAGIKVIHMVDSAGRMMMRKADIFLFGSDAISSDGTVINKIGTEQLASMAHACKIPVYSCTNSWKLNPETLYGFEEAIEERDPNEVWEDPPKGVKIFNPAFEATESNLVTGVITEIGIYKPETLVYAVKQHYSWMFYDHQGRSKVSRTDR